jgi:hypothetical protein
MRKGNTGILIGHATHNAELESTQTAKSASSLRLTIKRMIKARKRLGFP